MAKKGETLMESVAPMTSAAPATPARTLRDEFAMFVSVGALACEGGHIAPTIVATYSYAVADAMLAEKAKG